ncbi:biosynthetic peptidoglycan transglycosylase [Bacteriovorax sp. Seq25_V]|uniref:biosynthetic peptidoglycan transglycosylase n=1 Tax=Bacteriovorax sp. Seq25_V TaxID=1201288 RepID=UPI0018DFA92B|nr:biosynthetic peptidoglycan transglycosylase [Bacteriovorax sp. Seq25_V]
MKKLLILTFIGVLALGGWLYQVLGISQIKALREGYVEITKPKEGGVSYKVVSQRPKSWIKISAIPKDAYMAIVISEDWAFFDHHGFDYEQIEIALMDAIDGKKLRGASTITQQLAKNLLFDSERSFLRKVLELGSSIALEHYLSKDKILESYLNIIQYGEDLYGINQASQFYFAKSAKNLEVKEGAFLAMLLPSPVRYAQSFYDKELTIFASQVVDSIIDKLAIAKVITKDRATEVKGEPLLFRF